MYDVQITRLRVYKVRNLKDIEIPVSEPNGKRKHLIITGQNGSGKTSLLEAISKLWTGLLLRMIRNENSISTNFSMDRYNRL